jgi:hypothetical protein
VILGSARLYVCAHEQKRFVVALKYPGEEEYRYLVASDLSWRAVDIASAYTLRWLVEVFFEDWKLHEGWGQLAPQWDEEGSSRGLTLSLLLDHALLLHPQQRARLENNLPACTVGSLQQHSRMEALVDVIRSTVDAENPHQQLDAILAVAKRLFPLRDSTKHMNGRDLGRLETHPVIEISGGGLYGVNRPFRFCQGKKLDSRVIGGECLQRQITRTRAPDRTLIVVQLAGRLGDAHQFPPRRILLVPTDSGDKTGPRRCDTVSAGSTPASRSAPRSRDPLPYTDPAPG